MALITLTTPTTLLSCYHSLEGLNTQSTMITPKTASCVLVDAKRKILLPPFSLSISPSEYQLCNAIFPLLRVAVPALRDQEDQNFKLYKPLTDISISSDQSHLTEEQVNLADSLTSSHTLWTLLSQRPSVIDLVICVPDGQCSFFIY